MLTESSTNVRQKNQNMYRGIATWNPQVGCKFHCTYCEASFQRVVKRVYYCQGRKCTKCRDFIPHEHLNRLMGAFPSKRIVWPCAHGDIAFANPDFIKRVIEKTTRYPDRLFYWQSKAPSCFKQYLALFPENSILLTTLETNRDSGYRDISQAPFPSARFKAFLGIDWPRKIATVEPIMDFDPDIFLDWLVQLHPEAIWIGYNSKPKAVKLPEPPIKKTLEFVKRLEEHGIEVRKKTMR